MGFTDFGLLQFGSFIMGSTTPYASAMVFGTGSNTFIGSQAHLQTEFVRKTIDWTWNGTTPRGLVTFGSSEAAGSLFAEVGIGSGLTLGSNIWSRDLSAVGSKAPGYTLEFVFDFRAKRF